MIQCPKCGAANRRGSRFCNECGEALPMRTALRCPMCGTMNPVGNVYCDRCHARLIPMAASPSAEPEPEPERAPIKGLSLPTIPLGEQGEQAAEDRVAGAEPEQVDWLSGLTGPDVTAGAGAKDEAEAEEAADWLAQLRPTEVAGETEEIQEVETGEPADWLAALRRDDTSRPVEGRVALDEAEEPEPASSVEAVDLPDWLREMGPVSSDIEAAPPIVEGVPEEPVPAAEEMPDWLQEIAPPEAAPPTVEPAPPVVEALPREPMPTLEEMPEWLQEIAPPEAPPPTVEPASPVVEAGPEEPVPAAEDMPEWPQQIAPAEAAPPPVEPTPPVVEVGPEEPVPALEGIPDWLQEVAPPEAAPPAVELTPPVVEVGPEEAVPALEGIPEWLKEIAPAEAAPPPVEPTPPAVEVGPGEAVPAAEEMPEWLRELAPAEAAPLTVEPTPPVLEAMPEEPVPAAEEMPEWLRELAPPKAAPSALPSARAPSEGTPGVLPLVELPGETEITEAPDWLSELEAGPVPPPPPALEGIAPAEIPGWMQAMRPRPAQTEAIVEQEPLETTGLLEGLRGVITPAFALEGPLVRESVVPAEAREASLSRAQLLQSLLAQPGEVSHVEPLVRGPRVGEQIQRWLVALVLIATAILIVLTAPGMSLFYIPPLTQPAAPLESSHRMDLQYLMGAYNAIQGLSLGSGDSVLAAFEYGPTEADELNLVAEPLLRHLLERGAHISVVSTRAEGLTVAEGLLERIVESDDQYAEDQYSLTDYRPGNATGVSHLLASPDTPPSLILVLTAQPGPLRWWIEQTQARGEDATPLVAGVSAALEPTVGPYLAGAGSLRGAVSGLSGAAVYEGRLALPDSEASATRRLNALAVGQIAIVALIIVGAVLYAISGLRRKEE